MDLFHAVTQSLENVLSCHWFDEFQGLKPTDPSSSSSSTISTSASTTQSRRGSVGSNISSSVFAKSTGIMDKAMDTEKGGESTQYESIKTVTKPTEKQSGQMGDASTKTSEGAADVSTERGDQTADNIRYGQNISESGMGGMTTTSTGSAAQESGSAEGVDESPAGTRTQQGYGNQRKGEDHDPTIGG